jgi:hypothetical protein
MRTLLIRSGIFGGAPIALVRMSCKPAVFEPFDGPVSAAFPHEPRKVEPLIHGA